MTSQLIGPSVAALPTIATSLFNSATGVFSGTVTNSSGSIAGLTVVVFRANVPVASSVTASDGSFSTTLSSVTSGTALVANVLPSSPANISAVVLANPLLPATASFVATSAAGTVIWTPANKTAGSTITFTPTNSGDAGKIAVNGSGQLVVGLTAASVGSISGTLTETPATAGNAPVNSPLTITVSSTFSALPTVSASMAAIYAMAKVTPSGTYSGPLFQITRASDSATMDVSPLGTGLPDYTAIDTWIGGSSATVSIRYDQSGSGNHEVTIGTGGAKNPSFTNLAPSANGIRPCSFDSFVTPGTNTVNPKGLTLTGLTLAHNNFGLFSVVNPRISFQNAAYFEFLSGSTILYDLYQNATYSFGTQDQTNHVQGGRIKASRIQSVGMASGSTGQRVRKDKTSTSSASVAATLNMPTMVEGYSNSNPTVNTTGSFGLQDSFVSILFSSAPSDADFAALEGWADTAFALPSPTAPTKRLVYGGSSLIWGQASTLLRTPLQLMGLDPATWDAFNMGVPGQLLQTEYSNRATQDFVPYDGTKTKNVLIIDAPSNDINGATYTSTANAQSGIDSFWSTYVVPFISAAKTAGFSVIVPTCIARSSFGTAGSGTYREDARTYYNSSKVLANAASLGYTVSDRAGDSRLNTATNATYFTSDGAHPNDTGYAILASIDKAAVLAA